MFKYVAPVFCTALLVSTWAQAAPPRLASHSAVYELTLKDTRDRSMIYDLVGQMVVSTDINCGGLVFEQRLIMDFSDDEGNSFVNDFQISTWESLDGGRYRFSHVDRIDNEVTNRISGQALQKERSGGKAVFKEPDEKTVHLAPGTLFPTAHLLAVLEAAANGEQFHSTMIFDETSDTPVMEAVSIIGKPQNDDKAFDSDVVDDIRIWPVNVAFFDLEQVDGLPVYQVSFQLYENGVAGNMVMDFGEFSVRAKLVKLTPGDADACAEN